MTRRAAPPGAALLRLTCVPLVLALAACGNAPSPPVSPTVAPAPASPSLGSPAGEPASWRLDHNEALQGSSTKFTALVWRLACNGGVTGEVLKPTIDKTDSRIVITFTVTPQQPGAANCLGNNEVPYEVDLGEPLQGRPLLDGQCLNTPTYCENPTRSPS